ncbi:MAG: ATP-binding cassette domain-containing protein [Endomicrobium sp.]|jgi:ABC-2 type transport system ATP-binding protein|nr:ATP-binding cassette domain-containing protein [Endomicrobium sp.]
MEDKILEIKDLKKTYRKREVLHNTNFILNTGEIYGLIGRNGAGKTTFMKLITGLIKPTSGKVIFHNCSTNDIGLLIENPGLYLNLSAYDNMKIKAILVETNNNEIIELLELVGLKECRKMKVSKFSLGMKQRLSIALALLGNPKLLLLDEPVNGLDPQGISEIRNLIIRINKERNITILISSHILSELGLVCSRFGFIDNGNFFMEISREKLELNCCKQIIVLKDENIDKLIECLNRARMMYEIEENEVKIYIKENNEIKIVSLIDKLSLNIVNTFEKKSLEDYYFKITERNLRHNA